MLPTIGNAHIKDLKTRGIEHSCKTELTISLDPAKNMFQVYVITEHGKIARHGNPQDCRS